jgi:Mg2+-importing ATPase
VTGAPGGFWSRPAAEVLASLGGSPEGLSEAEAGDRLRRSGPNVLRPRRRAGDAGLFLGQFKSPIILILLLAAGLAFYLGDRTEALIILAIVLISGLLGFWQERGAVHAVEKLLAIVGITARAVRGGVAREVPLAEIVPGDVVLLAAGDGIPGDGLILESRDLYVDEAALTGETFPVEKSAGVLAADTALARRTNALFLGTHVVSGTARAVVVRTGRRTEFGGISEGLGLKPPETEFERGIRRFGFFLMDLTMVLVILIFGFNVFFHRPVLDSFMFSLALAVGLTPQLLPAIISINLAHGARRMAESKVIVKRLSSIENFGSMSVLCSDKTGTITEGRVEIQGAWDVEGRPRESVLRLAYLNALFETSFLSPIDEALRRAEVPGVDGVTKVDEVPYDFVRKRMSVLVREDGRPLMITKGALKSVLEVSTRARTSAGAVVPIEEVRSVVQQRFEEFSASGFRTLGLATRDLPEGAPLTRESEAGMCFAGFLTLWDPPKAGVEDTLKKLRDLGVTFKIITGDNLLVTQNLARRLGLFEPKALTGTGLDRMSEEALRRAVGRVDIFTEIEPHQKERIIRALRAAGAVVGFMGDGINDALALKASDVGLSVNSAVDVAKEAADIVLLEKDLGVLARGVEEGRKTFANTLKYIFMATSANFGNMFSMAGASLFLPFLPLLPVQILLTNLLTDFPEMGISTDRVDPETVAVPRRMDLRFIRRFMLAFGPLSSVFDFLTFGVLLLLLRAGPALFRTGWFVESVVSAALIVLVVRTRRPFLRSGPSRTLLVATLLVVAAAVALPYSPLAPAFGFVPLPPLFLAATGLIVLLYVVGAETLKRVFYRPAGS